MGRSRPSIAESVRRQKASIAELKAHRERLDQEKLNAKKVIATLRYDEAGQIFIQSLKDEIDSHVGRFIAKPEIPNYEQCVSFWTRTKTLMEMVTRLESTIENDEETN